MQNFNALQLSDNLVDLLKKQGIKEPTPIQSEAIPAVLNGADIIAESQTGTGKTLAFLLPMFESFDPNSKKVQGLIVTPTRELAIQITEVAKMLNADESFGILAAYGGQDIARQLKKLKNGIHLIIATPGRLLDHMRRETVDFNSLKMLVLDEADQMLHLGFRPEIDMILRLTPKKKQLLCFSATMDPKVKKIAYGNMNNPVEISVKKKAVTLDAIDQLVIKTTDRKKQDDLKLKLDEDKPFMAIIFCRTKRRVDALDVALTQGGYDVERLHGDLTQPKRERIMKRFRDLKIQFLIATDVAARGLDISGVTHIYNYDIPENPEIYIHRIGRTGRAGETGIATTFVAPKDEFLLLDIEKAIKMKLPVRYLSLDPVAYAENSKYQKKNKYKDNTED